MPEDKDAQILAQFARNRRGPKANRAEVGWSKEQAEYVNLRAQGLAPSAAARHAGLARVPKDPELESHVEAKRERVEVLSGMNRAKVLRGFEEAIDTARVQADAPAMIAGWREIGRMCGFYEAAKTEVNINIASVHKIQQLPDHELARLIEGEATVVDVDDDFAGDGDSDSG